MERRAARVSEAQWSIMLDFLEQNPNLARARGYNNSAQGRAESSRLWLEVAELLNAEGTGTTKTPKDWSTYVSNYKSKLKKIVADINADLNGTGGGPSRANTLSDIESRFLALMGQGFGQTAPRVSVNPFPDMEMPEPASVLMSPTFHSSAEEVREVVASAAGSPVSVEPTQATNTTATSNIPRQTRQRRYRNSRPLAPLDEARRILSQVEMQRAAADADNARAHHLIAQNIGRLADAAERYLAYLGCP